ncbi:MAG: ABC transporter permease, partial [Candidatus Atribacteria bacterium]|nr:ABC transporter permease [Candidatus Atribacteria bacterium]
MSRAIHFEKRNIQSVWWDVSIPFVSIFLALLSGAAFLAVLGVSPIDAYTTMFQASFGDSYGMSETVVKAIPLMIAGLAVMFSFRMSIWNIGAAGQIFIGALATTAAVRYTFVDNRFIMFWIMFAWAAVAGGLWAAMAGYLKAKWNVNEIITTLMLNYIAIHVVDYFIYGPWKDPSNLGFPMTAAFPEIARLPLLGTTRIHLGLFIALVFSFLFWLIFRYSRWGYE